MERLLQQINFKNLIRFKKLNTMKKKSSHIFIFMLLCSTIIFAQSTTSFDQNSVDRPGGSSTFIGVNSGNQTLTGWGNTFLGYNTGNNITNSGLNTFIGAYAGNSVTTGGVNTYIGTFAGSSNSTGSDNIYIGGFNGGNGSKSVIIGNGSGAYIRNNIEYNVFLGHNSGRNALSGGENVYIGSEAAYNNNGYQNIFIGNRAGYSEKTANNKLYVENSDSDTPLIYGDFFTNQLVFNGKVSTGLGNNSFPTVTDGGTDISTYTLFVKGGLLTEELRVLTSWADYVFEDTYNTCRTFLLQKK